MSRLIRTTLPTLADDVLRSIVPSQILQAFFILAAACVLFVAALPSEPRRLLTNYGARSSLSHTSSNTEGSKSPDEKKKVAAVTAADGFTMLASTLTSYGQIPHRWFIHFYILSVSSSLFWLQQYLSSGTVLSNIAMLETRYAATAPGSTGHTMAMGQIFLAWNMLLAQGTRRLYEEVYVMRPSKSTMWVVHWLLALGFYGSMSVGVWIEGSCAVLASQSETAPKLKAVFGTSLFLFGSIMQRRCHRHLASLKKYSLPSDGLFRTLVCPHYTCECLIYLGMAVAAAPPPNMLNRTLLCALAFVAANLGVTANGTKKWYEDKFGAEKLAGRWKMVPWVF